MVGYVIRDSDGQYGVCRARNSGVSTECISGRDDWLYTGVQAAVNVGITNLILETDATLVQQAVNHGDHRASLAGSLLYRWPNGSGTMGQHGPGPKKHETSTARHDVHSASVGTGTI